VWAGLDGNQSREQMLDDAIVATRGLARRQFTWLRGWQKKARITRIADPDPAQQTATLLRLAFQQGAGHSAVQNCDG
jgi:tRNA A37 N6-isopentenylltransferase MiaA